MLKDKDLKFALGEGVIEAVNIEDAYAKALADSFDFNNDKTKMKVVVDCGNGTGSIIIRKVYERLPFDVVYLYCDSNPNFPNHHPDPNVKANLRGLAEAVRRNKAQLGIAYDGDVDRAGFVDDKGNIVDADVITAILSKEIIKEAKNKTILIDVKCSKVCIDEIEANGGTVLMDTPSSACEERIIDEQDIPFCGSYSNHFFFRDRHPGYDDGIYTGLRVQEMLLMRKKHLSTIVRKLNLYFNTEELKMNVGDDKKWDIVEGFKKYCDSKKYKYNNVDGVRVDIKDGWALVRASNTGPNLTLRFESETKDGLNKIQKEVLDVLASLK
jgi:phosphomannomutase/phosphoglucomutase